MTSYDIFIKNSKLMRFSKDRDLSKNIQRLHFFNFLAVQRDRCRLREPVRRPASPRGARPRSRGRRRPQRSTRPQRPTGPPARRRRRPAVLGRRAPRSRFLGLFFSPYTGQTVTTPDFRNRIHLFRMFCSSPERPFPEIRSLPIRKQSGELGVSPQT